MVEKNFETLVNRALEQGFSGWDFSWLSGRCQEEDPPWDYRALVEERSLRASAMLDMGTGGGEFLASLTNLPTITYATESYPPNIAVAKNRLEPLNIRVIPFEDDKFLPLVDGQFDLVINRHESYWMPEVRRVLRSGGIFLTQQVGGDDCRQLNDFLGAPVVRDDDYLNFTEEVRLVEEAGFQILRSEEASLDSLFYDIGAVVYFLKVISWQIPDFSLERYENRLRDLHVTIVENGVFKARAQRLLIMAKKG